MSESELIESAAGIPMMSSEETLTNTTVSFEDIKYFGFGPGEYDFKLTSLDIKKIIPYCAPGYYDDTNGVEGCKSCPVGTYQPDEQKESCFPTDLGYYQDVEASVDQKLCPPGSYSDEIGLGNCKRCPFDRAADAQHEKTPKRFGGVWSLSTERGRKRDTTRGFSGDFLQYPRGRWLNQFFFKTGFFGFFENPPKLVYSRFFMT